MEEELLAIAEAMDDSPPDADGMALPPKPLQVTATQVGTHTSTQMPQHAEVSRPSHGSFDVTLQRFAIVIKVLTDDYSR